LIAVMAAAIARDFEGWKLAAFLTLFPIWFGTLTVAVLVMIPLWIFRLSKRLARKHTGKTTPQGRLWDEWMDSPVSS
jgi:hypothetical protein